MKNVLFVKKTGSFVLNLAKLMFWFKKKNGLGLKDAILRIKVKKKGWEVMAFDVNASCNVLRYKVIYVGCLMTICI